MRGTTRGLPNQDDGSAAAPAEDGVAGGGDQCAGRCAAPGGALAGRRPAPSHAAGHTRIGISTYSALSRFSSCTIVGAEPSEKRNTTCPPTWSVMSLR